MNTIAVTKSPADRRKVCVDEGRRAGGSATAGGTRGELAIWWAACLSSRGVARTRRARTRTYHRALPVRVAELVCDLGFDRVDDAHGVCLARVVVPRAVGDALESDRLHQSVTDHRTAPC
eukprot:31542-Pelagococcus_subviridis.AAC.11